jgi:hypothetical protein
MNRTNTNLILLLMIVAAIYPLNSSAESVYGTVSFVGTTGEYVEGGAYQATFRFRLSNSSCAQDQTKAERWVVVHSGRMDGPYIHNSVNFRNAYTTVMTAFLTGKELQVDGVQNCDSSKTQIVNLWSAQIGVH